MQAVVRRFVQARDCFWRIYPTATVRNCHLDSELLSGLALIEPDASADDGIGRTSLTPNCVAKCSIRRRPASSYRENATLTWIKVEKRQGVNV